MVAASAFAMRIRTANGTKDCASAHNACSGSRDCSWPCANAPSALLVPELPFLQQNDCFPESVAGALPNEVIPLSESADMAFSTSVVAVAIVALDAAAGTKEGAVERSLRRGFTEGSRPASLAISGLLGPTHKKDSSELLAGASLNEVSLLSKVLQTSQVSSSSSSLQTSCLQSLLSYTESDGQAPPHGSGVCDAGGAVLQLLLLCHDGAG